MFYNKVGVIMEKTYFDKLNNTINNANLLKMEEYAKINGVPIIQKEGLECLLLLAKLKNVKKVLEIGTAIGYSSSCLASISENICVDTIERDKKMYDEAIKNISTLGLSDRINVILADALDLDENSLENDYDLIFIDAAKSQYIKFFEKYEKRLKQGGVIFSDNLLFHGLIEKRTGEESRSLSQMLKKIEAFNEWLAKNDGYDTTFLKLGDGIAISIKK